MHQYLFYIGSFPIRSYGLVLSLSIILAVGVGYFLAKQDGRWHMYIVDMGIYCGLAGILGARLWDVFFFDWDYYGHHITQIFNVWQGGMAIQGGVFLGTIVGILYAKKHKIDVLALADILAPAIILGQAIGRCANLLNGDAFGAPTGTGFGLIYPVTTLAHQVYGNQPLWPAEVWEGQLDIVIFALLLIYRSFKHGRGQAFTLYVMLYSVARFFLEFLRGDYSEPVFGLCTSAQMTSIIAFIIAFFAYIYFGWRDRNKGAESEQNRNNKFVRHGKK